MDLLSQLQIRTAGVAPAIAERSSSATNSVVEVLTLRHSTSDTPAAGLGVRLRLALESSTTEDRDAATLSTWWSDPADSTRTASFALHLANSGALVERLRMTGSGQMALGNDITPEDDSQLTIWGPSAAFGQLTLAKTGGASKARLFTTGNGFLIDTVRSTVLGNFDSSTNAHARFAIVSNNADSYFAFYTANANNTFGTERMRIDKSGNVGIGRSPTYRVDIDVGSAGYARIISSGSGDSGYSDLLLENSNSGQNAQIYLLGNGAASGGGSNSLNFYTSGSGSAIAFHPQGVTNALRVFSTLVDVGAGSVRIRSGSGPGYERTFISGGGTRSAGQALCNITMSYGICLVRITYAERNTSTVTGSSQYSGEATFLIDHNGSGSAGGVKIANSSLVTMNRTIRFTQSGVSFDFFLQDAGAPSDVAAGSNNVLRVELLFAGTEPSVTLYI